MKKIAYCLISDGFGGAENIVLQTLLHFSKSTNLYLIINNEIADGFKNIIPKDKLLNIGDVYLHKKYKYLRYILNNRFYSAKRIAVKLKTKKVLDFIDINNIEIIHAHLDFALYLSLIIKNKQLNLKVIFTVHSAFGFLPDSDLKPQLDFKYIDFNKVDCFIFVSKYVYDIYSKKFAIRNYQIIYNGINKNCCSLTSDRIYNEGSEFNILYLGGEKLVKGYDVLIDTIKILVHEKGLNNIKVTVLGVVKSDGAIFKLLENKNLFENFKIIGFVKTENVSEYFDKAHLLFMPSRTEAMPLAAIEAVHCNLPIIASKVGGIPEIVYDAKNGFCSEIIPDYFAKNIELVMLNYLNFKNNTINYNSKIKVLFSIDHMCNKLSNLYSRI